MVYTNNIYQMKILSLKLQDSIFVETEKILQKLNTSRNSYINEAVAFYNSLKKRQVIAKKLERESELVAKESMKILKEFELLYE